MKYLAVRWVHSDPEYPVLRLGEYDGGGWEQRKIDVYRDGRVGFADAHEERDAELALVPMPGLEEIAAETESAPVEITRAEFERFWEQRRAGGAYWKAALLTTTRGDFLRG
jgi:hypothetical protein